jgi:Xaa-Pro dipeptidase
MQDLYREHIDHMQRLVEDCVQRVARKGTRYDGILFHAGTQHYYHADDRDVPFHTVAHFARFAPVAGPDHIVKVQAGSRPLLVRKVERDYWYEPPQQPDHPYADVLEVVEADSFAAVSRALGDVSGFAYVGNDPDLAGKLHLPADAVEPAPLMALLDWDRAHKTPYEVACLRKAAERAGRGHAAVRWKAGEPQSERALHAAYLEATGHLENGVPYTNIVGWDEHAAILHYQSKDASLPQRGVTLLIDAGAQAFGYASDITRTYVREGVHPVFRDLLDALDTMQRDLVSKVRAKQSYVELHEMAQRGVARILAEVGICKVSADEAFDRGHTRAFLPHGLGHHLGLQVHDVGGRQVSSEGATQAPPEAYPFLRTTRPLDVGHVVTIEPGIYFIPMLLEPLRQGPHAADFDWKLVDALVPCGGARIEDDVLVTANGPEDLTRPLVPGHDG